MIFHLAIGMALGATATAPLVWWLVRRSTRRAMARAHRAEARIRESERLADVGQLAAGLAHEIKNPLSTLSLNLQLLAEDWSDEEADSPRGRRVRRKIDLLTRETERLSGVLDDFLRFARGHDLKPDIQDLNLVMEEVLEFFAPEAQQRGIEIRRYLHPVPNVRVDGDLIKQALLNILVNAQQAMPQGGELTVQTGLNGEGVSLEIIDTGCGISPEDREKIFKPYFSTKQGGTGLGLPMARRIVEEHEGRIKLESELNQGTRVTILLPSVGDMEPGSGPTQETPSEEAGHVT